MASYCRACPAELIWCKMHPSGKPNPLDPQEIALRDVLEGRVKNVVAYNPRTGGGTQVTKANLDLVEGWVLRGAVLHLSHWATCPARKQLRMEFEQGDVSQCPVPGCSEVHPKSMLMCRGHWYAVPAALRNHLWEMYREPGIVSEEYRVARAACIEAAKESVIGAER